MSEAVSAVAGVVEDSPTAVLGPSPEEPRRDGPSREAPGEAGLRRHDILTAIQSLLVVVVIATFIVTFIVQPFRIPSESMDPTLRVGDFLLMNKQAFTPRGPLDAVLPPTPVRRGDVAVFHYPVDPAVDFVKRVVGLPGDRLRLHDGRLYINGRRVEEPYAFYGASIPDSFRDNFPTLHSMDANVDPAWWMTMRRNVRDGELYIPADRYFVMGDNRNDSEDSRYWGFVPRSALVGRPMLVYLSMGERVPGRTALQRLADSIRGERLVR
jgi:signal peptidase I